MNYQIQTIEFEIQRLLTRIANDTDKRRITIARGKLDQYVRLRDKLQNYVKKEAHI